LFWCLGSSVWGATLVLGWIATGAHASNNRLERSRGVSSVSQGGGR
jgi:hypothetical protein